LSENREEVFNKVLNALRVLVLTRKTAHWLEWHDPKALQQAREAVEAAGYSWRIEELPEENEGQRGIVFDNGGRAVDSVELRVTRPSMYPRDCQNPTYMQGHYFKGIDFSDAYAKAMAQFPGEDLHAYVFKRLIGGAWQRV